MEATNQQSQNVQFLTDIYYDQALNTQNENSFNEISQYDSSLDYLSDTWTIEEVVS